MIGMSASSFLCLFEDRVLNFCVNSQIALTNSPIPVFTSVCDDETVVPEDRVVQDDNSRLVPDANVVATSGDEPLLRFKITYFKRIGETALGITWNHVLGISSVCRLNITCPGRSLGRW